MQCYKDRTFCQFYADCEIYITEGCRDALTSKEAFFAVKVGLPIAQFLAKPKCFKEARQDDKEEWYY